MKTVVKLLDVMDGQKIQANGTETRLQMIADGGFIETDGKQLSEVKLLNSNKFTGGFVFFANVRPQSGYRRFVKNANVQPDKTLI